MNRSCANESELFNLTVKTINLHKFYFDGVGVSVFGILGLFGITSITTNFDVIIIVTVFTIITITNTKQYHHHPRCHYRPHAHTQEMC